MANQIEKLLEQNNVKPTAMRLLVLQFLLNKKVTVSLANIEEYFDNSDRTTLYRTLKTFVERVVLHIRLMMVQELQNMPYVKKTVIVI